MFLNENIAITSSYSKGNHEEIAAFSRQKQILMTFSTLDVSIIKGHVKRSGVHARLCTFVYITSLLHVHASNQ